MTFPKLKKLNLKQKFAFSVVIYLVMTLAIVYFLILPFARKIIDLNQVITTYRIELFDAKNNEANKKRIDEKITRVEAMTDRVSSIFINQNRELEFITTLEDVAARYNIEQKINLNPADAKTDNNYKKVPIELTANGGFYNIVDYLKALQSLPYYINVSAFSISGGQQQTVKDATDLSTFAKRINLRILGVTYWR